MVDDLDALTRGLERRRVEDVAADALDREPFERSGIVVYERADAPAPGDELPNEVRSEVTARARDQQE
jgi:hypothetical protein